MASWRRGVVVVFGGVVVLALVAWSRGRVVVAVVAVVARSSSSCVRRWLGLGLLSKHSSSKNRDSAVRDSGKGFPKDHVHWDWMRRGTTTRDDDTHARGCNFSDGIGRSFGFRSFVGVGKAERANASHTHNKGRRPIKTRIQARGA